MRDTHQKNWSARSRAKGFIVFKKARLQHHQYPPNLQHSGHSGHPQPSSSLSSLSSSSPGESPRHTDRQPYLDEIPTIQQKQVRPSLRKSGEAFLHMCTIPLSMYRNKLDSQETLINPALVRKIHKKRSRRERFFRAVLVVCLLLMFLAGGSIVYGYHYYDTTVSTPLKHFIHQVQRSSDEPALKNTPSYNVIMGRSWNILLLGSDNDGKYTFPDVLTQVIMIVHIDTVTGQVAMVSIPRDSWVQVPEIGGMHKLDQAFLLGASQRNNFDAGVRSVRLTIEKDYGVPIDRYAWVGLSGFAKVIDTLGGVDIDVIHPIVDDNYPDDTGDGANPLDPYALKRLSLAPGLQHLDGTEALEYVRSRHADLIGDIGRTQRQQQVLEALKKKLSIDTLLSDIPQLMQDLTGSVYTDLSEQEMLAFANFGRSLSNSAIQHVTLGPGTGTQDYGDLTSVNDPSLGEKQDVVIPNCTNIQPLLNTIFVLGNVQSCNVTG